MKTGLRVTLGIGIGAALYWGFMRRRTPDNHPPRIRVEGLSHVSETLLVPLYLRAVESLRPDGLISDSKAVELVDQLDYNFVRFKGAALSGIFTLLRMREFDRRVSAFLSSHPDGIIVDIGCGLDTRYFRLDNGKAAWYELDLPEVIGLRRQLLGEAPRRHIISRSALDLSWMDEVISSPGQPILFLAEGVFPYFEQQEVKFLVTALSERFSGAELVFDALPPDFARWMRWHPALKVTKARLNWSLADSKEPEQWHPAVHLMSEWFYFDQSEPRLRWYRLLEKFPPMSRMRIVQYSLGGKE